MDSKGFFGALFDFSFNSLITPRIVKVIYALALIFDAFYSLGILIFFFQIGNGVEVLGLIFAPLAFLLFAIMTRVYLEVVMVLFKIGDNTSVMAGRTDRSSYP